ncbi:hypothetical protein CPJCM30710_30310 [Clostridium polyendosporum]|uniref:Uncharacterized protein n=1 Tax=Clostridium polyendosporum TaxID=69208 RepID=A0A919S166_9CLOT|nr:hypothetical protein [Clostridium polyendosporum]GIM30365.1 hypothetical protein CPJCM30710_30310 [Clostridium polyendosporum]
MALELNSSSANEDYIVDNETFTDEHENYKTRRAYMLYMPCMLCINCIMNQQKLYMQQYDFPYAEKYNYGKLEPNYIADYYRAKYQDTPDEIQQLQGKKIRTTLPNIVGTVTATFGQYNANTNGVQFKNIISDRTGVNYGNLNYLLEEIGGLEELSAGPEAQDCSFQGIQDCTITGEKGKYIDLGEARVGVASIKYIIHECEIEITPTVNGIMTEKYIINRRNNKIKVKWPTSFITRYVFTAWIQNKALWVKIEMQHKILTGQWRRTGGTKTKLGSWASLKI